MRMQSPASSGLLPASYSRRRRTRPNETPSDGSTSQGVGVVASYYHDAPGVSDNLGLSPRRSPNGGRRPLYTLSSRGDDRSSDDSENDENDRRRGNRPPDAYERGYEDVLDKPLPLSDFLINDQCYERYQLEGKRASYRGYLGGKNATISNDKGFMDPAFLARVCAGCSFVGMLFLIWVAIMMETQPLYIKGVSAKPNLADDGSYRFRKETANALKAAAAYFLTMVCSLIYLQTKDMNLELNPAMGRICHLRRLLVSSYFRYRRRHYDAIPDGSLPMHSNGGGDRLLKSRRRRKRRSRREGGGEGGGAIEGMLGRIKSWGIGGGSSRGGRKKDR
ncbi:hypothetical protein ACHAXT_008209 [Thalassiosira profunda]